MPKRTPDDEAARARVITFANQKGGVDKFMNSRMGRELMLSRALEPISDNYDFVIVDTPPALQVRTLNGIAAADDVVVPCMADASSVAGLKAVLEYVAEVEEFVRGASSKIISLGAGAMARAIMMRWRRPA